MLRRIMVGNDRVAIAGFFIRRPNLIMNNVSIAVESAIFPSIAMRDHQKTYTIHCSLSTKREKRYVHGHRSSHLYI